MRPEVRGQENKGSNTAMRYLVDTDWVIHYLKGNQTIVRALNRLLLARTFVSSVGISIISMAELYDGVIGSADPEASERQLRNFLAAGIDVLDIDTEICRIFAEERVRLRAAGNIIGDFDLLIGATARRHHLTLLTNNRRHFERMQGLSIFSA